MIRLNDVFFLRIHHRKEFTAIRNVLIKQKDHESKGDGRSKLNGE